MQNSDILIKETALLSKWVWNTLAKSNRLGSRICEESITDFLVLRMKEKLGQICMISSFTKKEEKVSGADWELWFTEKSRQKWVGFRMQAKIISKDGTRYSSLHYTSSDGSRQTEALISRSAEHGALPLYCLYSHWKSPDRSRLIYLKRFQKENIGIYGLSIVPAHRVRLIYPDKSLDTILDGVVPFPCLF